MQYYIQYNGQTVGPMTAQQIMGYNPNANTMVSRDGGDWKPLYQYPELMDLLQNHARMTSSGGVSQKTLCGILAIIVGCLGIQYFVLGKTAAGIYTILLSIITCGAWSIVTLIQGILMLCMTDAEFERKYVNTTSTFPLF